MYTVCIYNMYVKKMITHVGVQTQHTHTHQKKTNNNNKKTLRLPIAEINPRFKIINDLKITHEIILLLFFIEFMERTRTNYD